MHLCRGVGGKDCMLALHLALKYKEVEPQPYLLNMCDAGGTMSRSHGLSAKILEAQAEAMGLPLRQESLNERPYEIAFKDAITDLKKQGASLGIFGDIYLETHRVWVERVCSDMGIKPLFPLWGMSSEDVVETLIREGFKTKIVSVRNGMMEPEWLGKDIDTSLFEKLKSMDGLDCCGERGEYHTLVWDGPLFRHPLHISSEGIRVSDKHNFLEVRLMDIKPKVLEKDFGLVHIYTGEGKGKTTAAVGLATRALGGGFAVCYCSFHKRPEKYGYTEMESLRKMGADVYNFAKGHPRLDKSVKEERVSREAKAALPFLSKLLQEKHFDLLILDEIIISVREGYISEESLLEFIRKKPKHTELILTGRAASDSLIAVADYVTECTKVKHPFDRKIASRKGIEF